MTLELEVGKFYRARNGTKWKAVEAKTGDVFDYFYCERVSTREKLHFTPHGVAWQAPDVDRDLWVETSDDKPSAIDLVAEWKSGDGATLRRKGARSGRPPRIPEHMLESVKEAGAKCLAEIIASDAPGGVKVQAAKILLDRTLDPRLLPPSRRNFAAMSADELANEIEKLEAKAAELAKAPENTLDVFAETPIGSETPTVSLVLPPVRVAILHEGAELTNGSRDAEYGPPSLNMAAAGELKQVFRKHLNRNITPGELEAVELALTKLGRIATGAKPKRDTYVDCATYIAIAGEIALAQLDGLS